MVVVSVASSERTVGIKVSLTAVELIVATITVPPVGHRALELAEELPGEGPDGVPTEEPRLEERFDDSGYGVCAAATPDDSPDGVPTAEPGLDGGPDESANEGCPTGTPAATPEGAGAKADEPPAVCPSTGAKTLKSKDTE